MFLNDDSDIKLFSTIRGKSLYLRFADVSVTVGGALVSLVGVVVTGNTGGVPRHILEYQASLTRRTELAYRGSGPRISSQNQWKSVKTYENQ